MSTATIAERAKRTERAKQARQDEILAAARRVFATQGFRGTTIADIADEAKIALGTIYLYFASKDDVFAALNEQLNTLITAALADVPGQPTLAETVRLRIDNVFAMCSENRDLVRLVVLNIDQDSAATKRMRRNAAARTDPMVQILKEAMEAGFIREADAHIMTKLIFGLVSIAVYQAYVVSDGVDADKYREACTEMITAYMMPEAANVAGRGDPPSGG